MFNKEESISLAGLELLRTEATKEYSRFEPSFKEVIYWTMPHRMHYLTGGLNGSRNNHHIVDPTHIVAQRSYVAGFLEGNTSASRAWFKFQHPDPVFNRTNKGRKWIDHFNERCMINAQQSNAYMALGEAYHEHCDVGTGVLYRETKNNQMFFHVLPVGTYKLLMGSDGRPDVLFFERTLTVKQVVDEYGTYTESGKADWSKFSDRVKTAYENCAYAEEVEIVTVVKPNKMFNEKMAELGQNRRWVAVTYESPRSKRVSYDPMMGKYEILKNPDGSDKILRIGYAKSKPFIGFKGSGGKSPYGENSPAYESLGLIKALNRRRLKKDKAIDQMVDPTTFGPASIRKSYLSTNPSTHIPLSDNEMAKGGMKRLFEINPAIGALIQDTQDERGLVNKLYFQDFLLYLTQNQKTRTAEEVRAVQSEQQMVVGPNFQVLNWTLNLPFANMIAEWTLDNDPYLEPPPPELGGQSLQPTFISLFAQAQKSSDLPNIQTFLNMILGMAPVNQEILLSLDSSVLADIYSDRLFLPYGLVRSKEDVDAMKAKMQADMQRQQNLEALQATAGAAKDLNINGGKSQ